MLRRNAHMRTSIAVFVFFCLPLWGGCTTKTPPPPQPAEPLHIQSLLILPFQDMARMYGENATFQCRLSGNVFTTGKVAPEADKWITEQVTSYLRRQTDLTLIPESLAEGATAAILFGEKGEMPEAELLGKIGMSVGADAVLVGKVYRFREREGTGFSVDSPASVAFGLNLLRVADGRLVWTGHFDQTQQSLFEDLFQWTRFWKRKARWITAEQLALEGVHQIFETFPVK